MRVTGRTVTGIEGGRRGNGEGMTDETVSAETTTDDPRLEVLQAVVDRVTSWQERSSEDIIGKELDDALAESDVTVEQDVRDRIVGRIHADGSHFDVREVLFPVD